MTNPSTVLSALTAGMVVLGYATVANAQCDGRGSTWGPGIGPPPAGCGGGAPPGGGGGGASITVDGVSTASIRGSIGTAKDGNQIYGPFDAGFRANQLCNGHATMVGGMDTGLAVAIAQHECNDNTVGLFDNCGGHAQPYHYHEGMTCLYNTAASGHSTSVGDLSNGQKLYGKWEDTNVLPELDACNGHFGYTPDSPNAMVYHYHITEEAPFTVGCFGPATDTQGNEALVTVEQCRAVYGTCDGATTDFTTVSSYHGGSIKYDLDCPCFDANEQNQGTIAPITYGSGTVTTKATVPPAPPATDAPTAAPTDAPTQPPTQPPTADTCPANLASAQSEIEALKAQLVTLKAQVEAAKMCGRRGRRMPAPLFP